MTTLTIKLDEKLEALRRQLALARLELLRKELAPYAQACGWLTDYDVFREVS